MMTETEKKLKNALEGLLNAVLEMRNPQTIADVALLILKFKNPVENAQSLLLEIECRERSCENCGRIVKICPPTSVERMRMYGECDRWIPTPKK